jgi:ABC-2 type transport system ATP-binding protein
MDATGFNKLMFEKGITLSHLVKRKESLEEQFLKLTDDN